MPDWRLRGRLIISFWLLLILLSGSFVFTHGQGFGITVVWENSGNPDSLDPHIDYENFGFWIISNVYETLYTYDWSSSDTDPSIPLLAKDLTISSDLLNYTIRLQEGVTFHDGTPFNASCVKYNIGRVLALFYEWGPAWLLAEPILGGKEIADAVQEFGMGSSGHRDAYNRWLEKDAVMVLDTYTVRIRLEYPYAPFIKILANPVTAMISPTWVEKNGGVQIGRENLFVEEHTCGTGPYIVDQWAVDEEIILRESNNYWRAADAKVMFPYAGAIDTIVIRTNDDENSRILNIEADETDGCYWPTSHADLVYNGYEGDSEDGTLKSSIPNLKLWCGEPTFNVRFLGMNMHTTLNTSWGIVANPLMNKSVRECFSYAFNYQALIDDDANGFGVQQRGLIPKGMFGFDEELFRYEYNLSKAAKAWNDAMANGWLDNVLASNDYTLAIYYPIGGSTFREISSLILADGLENMLSDDSYGAIRPSQDLSIQVQGLEFSNYMDYYWDNGLLVYFWGWIPDIADPDNFVHPYVVSTMEYPELIGLGTSNRWDTSAMDGLVREAAGTINETLRETIYDDIQTTLVEHVAYLWCYQATNFHVEDENLMGYIYNPMREPYFYHMFKLDAETEYSVLLEQTLIASSISAIIVLIGLAVIIDNRSAPRRNRQNVPYQEGSNYQF